MENTVDEYTQAIKEIRKKQMCENSKKYYYKNRERVKTHKLAHYYKMKELKNNNPTDENIQGGIDN